MNIHYHLNKADAGQLASEDKDDETWQISPHLKLYLLEDLYLLARYTYSQVEDRIADTTRGHQRAILELAYNVTLWD